MCVWNHNIAIFSDTAFNTGYMNKHKQTPASVLIISLT